MSREIKFRAWDEISKEWIYFDLDDAISGRIEREGYKPLRLINKNRYTGLLDKNGVEIYEGDILKAPHFQTAAVEYIESGFWCKQGKYNMLPNLTGAEVIGNIHEHGNLLEQPNEPR